MDEVRDLLYKQATSAIDHVLESASNMRDASFGAIPPVKSEETTHQESAPSTSHSSPLPGSKKNGASKIKIQFPDGSNANVSIPDVQ